MPVMNLWWCMACLLVARSSCGLAVAQPTGSETDNNNSGFFQMRLLCSPQFRFVVAREHRDDRYQAVDNVGSEVRSCSRSRLHGTHQDWRLIPQVSLLFRRSRRSNVLERRRLLRRFEIHGDSPCSSSYAMIYCCNPHHRAS